MPGDRNVYRFGPYELDAAHRRLMRGRERMRVPARQLDLIALGHSRWSAAGSDDPSPRDGQRADIAIARDYARSADGMRAAAVGAMADDRLTVAQMSAELLRELGLLLVAFGPLDYLLSHTALTPPIMGAIVAVGGLLILTGIVIERRRPV